MKDLKNKFNFKLIYLVKGTKNKPVHKYKDDKNLFDVIPSYKDFNYAVKTGKTNNIIVIDIDSYKEEFKTKSDFIKKFPNYENDYFNTYSVKSAKGGHHFYFKYDEELKQTASEYYIDIRSDNGYIVGAGSRTEDGIYKVVNDADIITIPNDLKQWLLSHLYKKKIINDDDDNNDDNKNIVKEIKYLENLEDKEIDNLKKNIIKLLEKEKQRKDFFKSYNEFLYFTTSMKKLNLKKTWDDFNKTQNDYNYEANMKIWNSCKDMDLTLWLKKKLNFGVYDLYKPILKNKIKPDKIIESQKLGYKIILKNNYLIKSDTGTGKTTSFMEYIESNKFNFISICSRKSLVYEQYNNFNENKIDCINYDIVENDEIIDGQNIMIQIDSLTRLHNIKNFNNYVIFLDEFNSIILYLIQSSTLNKIRITIFNLLIRILSQCKQFICTDADISDISIKFIDYIKRPYEFIENTYKHNKGINAQEIFNYDKFINKLENENKFMLCTDSKTQAEIIYKKLDDDTIKLITSENDDEYINLDSYDKVIFSPKIIYGLDSTLKRNVYCLYTEKTISPTSYLQQIARCRNIDNLYFIFTHKAYKENYETFEQKKKYLKKVNDYSLKEFKFLTSPDIYNLYYELVCMYDYNNDCYNTNKFCHFINLLKQRGFNYIDKRENVEIDRIELIEIKKEIYNDKLENFDINNKRYKKINEILKIPEDKINDYKDYFINPYLLLNHFSISKFYKENDKELKEELNNKDEFNINKIKSIENKIKFLLLLKRLTYNNDLYTIDSKPPIMTDINKLNEEYKILFDKVNNKDFNDVYECNKLQYKLYNEIFKDNLSFLSVCDSEKIQEQKKRKQIYTVNKKYFEKDLKLLNFRYNPLKEKINNKERIIKVNKNNDDLINYVDMFNVLF